MLVQFRPDPIRQHEIRKLVQPVLRVIVTDLRTMAARCEVHQLRGNLLDSAVHSALVFLDEDAAMRSEGSNRTLFCLLVLRQSSEPFAVSSDPAQEVVAVFCPDAVTVHVDS